MKYLFKSIFRNFTRKPVTNLINLLGLSVSLALVIILSAYCYSELTTDSFQKNAAQVCIYGLEDHIYTPGILKDNIDSKVPGVEATVRLGGTWEAPVFQTENKEPIISDLIFADQDFFRLFTYKFIEGNIMTALKEPMTIVITKTLSDKLFGKDSPLGKSIKLNNDKSLTVSAVIEQPDANSCLKFNAVTSMATRKIVQENGGEYTDWGWCDFQTFVLLKKGADPIDAEKTILSLFPEENRKDYRDSKLTPLKKIYFSKFSLLGSSYIVSGDRKKVQILVLVASLVLIIALINFINISSSQWREKIRQTGVLKIIGAKRSSILRNILIEAFFFFLVAFVISIELVKSMNHLLSNYTGIIYSEKLTGSAAFLLVALALIAFLSIAFSIVPAMRISSSGAVENLKKNLNHNKSRFSFRDVFVILQFTIAIILISFTFLVRKQVRFGSNDLGFNQENILSIKLTEQLSQKKDVLENILKENPAVKKISFSAFYPGNTNQSRDTELNVNGDKKPISFDLFSADAEFFEMLDLQLVSGRLYTDNLSSDKNKLVVNETFLRENKVANPVGGTVTMGSSYEIVGVIRDFHYKPVNLPITALAIRNESHPSYCLVALQTSDFKLLNTTVNSIKKAVTDLSPSFPVEISFFDQAIQNMYQSELKFFRTFSIFAVCAIVICSLGILAMSIFGCQRRIKEIGIRKVNGAKISEILEMLNKDFVKWVGLAFLISCPVAWYAMHKWLQGFVYKTDISWWIFVLSGLMALAIALLTVSLQSWRAATRNPVEALRYE